MRCDYYDYTCATVCLDLELLIIQTRLVLLRFEDTLTEGYGLSKILWHLVDAHKIKKTKAKLLGELFNKIM